MRTLLVLLLCCGLAQAQPTLFSGRDGCYLLIRLRDGQVVDEINPTRCAERFSPCSTFKIAAALMAFDSQLYHLQSQFKWDGHREEREECNQDQTPESWMKRSVVWVTQQITTRLGLPRVQGYLKRFRYGNQDFRGGLTQAWLTSSLQISALEQARFLRDLYSGRLEIRAQAARDTISILVRDGAPGAVLEGKTGSGRLSGDRQLGWFVGHLHYGGDDYISVLNFSDRLPHQTEGPAGWKARELTKKRLQELHLWP